MTLHPKYRTDIDGLRAIAVLAVVAFHAFPSVVIGGFTGVDVFFVISGFLISTILYENLEHNQFSFIDFYSRRIRRIFPALILVLTCCFALGWFVLLPDEYKQLGKHMAGGAGFVQNFVLWNEADYFDNIAETKPLLHLWSLGIEEQFYIVWPVLLWLAYRLRTNLLALTVVIGLISFGLNIYGVKDNGTGTFYSPQTRFWELLIGAALAYITLHPQVLAGKWSIRSRVTPQTWAHIRSLTGAALLMAGLVLINKKSLFPGWWALLPTIGSALILSAGPNAWFNQTILSNKILTWFGLISYPLYLWHWALLSFARIMEGQTPPEWVRAVLVLIAIALSALTYYLVEKPIRFGKHLKAKTIILVILMTIVGGVGYNTYKREGLGFRLPKDFAQLSNYQASEVREISYTAWRRYSCFLEDSQTFSAYAKCETVNYMPNKPSILLWGDSHAASLYPGIESKYSSQFNVVQRTTALCPPILGFVKSDRPNCKKINDDIFSYIKHTKPNVVVLSAWWNDYEWAGVEETIQKLVIAGVQKVYLVGPLPQWEDQLPSLVFRKYKSDPLRQIPRRMNYGLQSIFVDIDSQMQGIANRQDVDYFSPRSVLCNLDGCMTIVNNGDHKFIAFDTTHLTIDGSKYLASKFDIKYLNNFSR